MIHTSRDPEKAKETYEKAMPFPHIVIDPFLEDSHFETLEQDVATLTFYGKESDLFSFAQTNDLHNHEETLGNLKGLSKFIKYIDSQEFADFISQLTGKKVKAGSSDLFAAIYQDTDYLLCHDDQLENRSVAWILYLTDLEVDQGGNLLLYDDINGQPGKVTAKIQPKANSLVVFTVSDKSWHEVEEVREANRVSIGGWMHE